MTKHLQKLISKKQYEEMFQEYSLETIARSQSFEDNLQLALKVLYFDWRNYDLRNLSVDLLHVVRTIYSEKWNESWKNDVFLGVACDLASRYDERYEAFRRAYNGLEDPPPTLLIWLASCHDAPGPPVISYDESVKLLKQALKDKPYRDGLQTLRLIHIINDKREEADHIKDRLDKLGDEAKQSPSIEPDFLLKEIADGAAIIKF